LSPVPVLRIENAHVVRDGRAILSIPELEIHEGQHTAILGPNGAGKTTLLRMIGHSIYPHTGADEARIEVFGQSRWDVFELRKLLGLVSQDLQTSFTFHPGLTAVEAVLTGYFATQIHRPKDITQDMIDTALASLDEVGALPLADRKMAQLSLGEARRVVIARALVPKPKALLLDEPCTGLDFGARHHFLQALRGVAQRGTTMLIVTHDLEDIIPEISRVILLKQGTIFADGSPADVLDRTTLSDLYGVPPERIPSFG